MRRSDDANVDLDSAWPLRPAGPSHSRVRGAAWPAGTVASPRSRRGTGSPVGFGEETRAVATAPVKAPLTYPKSSLSSSCSGNAAQLRDTNARPARWLSAWRARATRPLPVPVSPRMITGAGASATRWMRSLTAPIAGLCPRSVEAEKRVRSAVFRAEVSRLSRASSSARARKIASSSCLKGFVR